MLKFIVLTILTIFNILSTAAASPSISGTMSYEYNKKWGEAKELTPDITINLYGNLHKKISFLGTFESNRTIGQPATNTINNTFVEYANNRQDYKIGKQSYALSNGLIASMSGMNGIYANFSTQANDIAVFYGNNKNILAGALSFNRVSKDVILETDFFHSNQNYAGITVSGEISNHILLSIETAENIHHSAFGYLITLENGSLREVGASDISLSFRNIAPEAVSEYCVDSNYDNSKGFRIGLSHRISNAMILTAYRDIAETRDNVSLDKTYIAVSNNF